MLAFEVAIFKFRLMIINGCTFMFERIEPESRFQIRDPIFMTIGMFMSRDHAILVGLKYAIHVATHD